MTEIFYEELPEMTRAHLHATELREYYQMVKRITNGDSTAAARYTHTSLLGPENPRWREEVYSFLDAPVPRSVQVRELTEYYLTAGVGIRKIMQLVGIGQSRVYTIRDNFLQIPKQPAPITAVFLLDGRIIYQLQEMTERVNILNGYRVLGSERRHNPFGT